VGMDEAREGTGSPLRELSGIPLREVGLLLVSHNVETGSNRPWEPRKSAAKGGHVVTIFCN
jgi:hypothetical protein